MISNEREFTSTRRKLQILERERDALDATTEPSEALRRSCQLSLSRLINQFKEEMSRYRSAQTEKVFLRRVIKTPQEAENTRVKLANVERLIQARSTDATQNPASRASLGSLRRTRNKLKEQVLWYEAKARQSARAGVQSDTAGRR